MLNDNGLAASLFPSVASCRSCLCVQGNTVLHFLENNFYRSEDVRDLMYELAPEIMQELEEVRSSSHAFRRIACDNNNIFGCDYVHVCLRCVLHESATSLAL